MPFDDYVWQFDLNKRSDVMDAFRGLSFSPSRCCCGFDGKCRCKDLANWDDVDALCSSVNLEQSVDVLGSLAALIHLHVFEPTGPIPVKIQQLRHLYFCVSTFVEKLARCD